MGIKDALLKMIGKEPNKDNIEEAQENISQNFTAKPGTLENATKKGMSKKAKIALAAILATGAIALSGMAPDEAHAAGGEINGDVVFLENMEGKVVPMGKIEMIPTLIPSNDPLGIRVDNPDSQWYNPDYDSNQIQNDYDYHQTDKRSNSYIAPGTKINTINNYER